MTAQEAPQVLQGSLLSDELTDGEEKKLVEGRVTGMSELLLLRDDNEDANRLEILNTESLAAVGEERLPMTPAPPTAVIGEVESTPRQSDVDTNGKSTATAATAAATAAAAERCPGFPESAEEPDDEMALVNGGPGSSTAGGGGGGGGYGVWTFSARVPSTVPVTTDMPTRTTTTTEPSPAPLAAAETEGGGGGGAKKASPPSSSSVKGRFTKEEDSRLVSIVETHGCGEWTQVAAQMTGRNATQCRKRWQGYLDPDIKRDTWTFEENRQLIDAHDRLGDKWAKMAKIIVGRTCNAIKTHWFNTLKPKVDDAITRGLPPYAAAFHHAGHHTLNDAGSGCTSMMNNNGDIAPLPDHHDVVSAQNGAEHYQLQQQQQRWMAQQYQQQHLWTAAQQRQQQQQQQQLQVMNMNMLKLQHQQRIWQAHVNAEAEIRHAMRHLSNFFTSRLLNSISPACTPQDLANHRACCFPPEQGGLLQGILSGYTTSTLAVTPDFIKNTLKCQGGVPVFYHAVDQEDATTNTGEWGAGGGETSTIPARPPPAPPPVIVQFNPFAHAPPPSSSVTIRLEQTKQAYCGNRLAVAQMRTRYAEASHELKAVKHRFDVAGLQHDDPAATSRELASKVELLIKLVDNEYTGLGIIEGLLEEIGEMQVDRISSVVAGVAPPPPPPPPHLHLALPPSLPLQQQQQQQQQPQQQQGLASHSGDAGCGLASSSSRVELSKEDISTRLAGGV